jgi:hypothetical protein
MKLRLVLFFMLTPLLTLAFLLSAIATPQAQTVVNLVVEWDPNVAGDGVTSYSVSLVNTGGGLAIPSQVVTPSMACTDNGGSICHAFFTGIPTGNFIASVVATNQWGAGEAGTASITITVPSKVQNVRGRKG